ncbi:MAG: NAD(+)/NADH kinase [Candidatus Odinarchaeum yellowstonii]|uniref:NAD kinase n=1 Tax=Odinarchaeota yellowstonii (strain LCB_4) TaxID=1841599 RepID=A0AAF0D0W2_ODILC|nr:MAG: NAD(+)/NADH kinase [Candidatus Odinarchaeum yellowstonii]
MIKRVLLKVRPDLVNSPIKKRILDAIEERNLKLYLEPESVGENDEGREVVEPGKADVDCAIIVGGDGTILYTIRNLPAKCPLILGVDAGTTGFLSEITPDEIEPALDRLLNGEYKVSKSFRLKTFIDDVVLPEAVNEVLVTTEPGKSVKLDVYIDNHFLNSVVADGVIVATPTGSTAYGLSAGGSIIDPDLEAYTIVPVAPFKASLSPIVLSSDKVVAIKSAGRGRNPIVVIDGQVQYSLTRNEVIRILKSENYAPFIRFRDEFYSKIREKLLTVNHISEL